MSFQGHPGVSAFNADFVLQPDIPFRRIASGPLEPALSGAFGAVLTRPTEDNILIIRLIPVLVC